MERRGGAGSRRAPASYAQEIEQPVGPWSLHARVGPTLPALIFACGGVLAEIERFGHLPAFNQTFREFSVPVQWSDTDYAEKLRIGGGQERTLSILTPDLCHWLGLDPLSRHFTDATLVVSSLGEPNVLDTVTLADPFRLRPGATIDLGVLESILSSTPSSVAHAHPASAVEI